ncbi:acyltransferase [Agrococcus sp. ProA11]|uniref:acyltransferase family protein n=1 Tax=Agrococcus chionoecetis TaxID=3153752 RepID=UPI003260CFEF
MGPTIAERYEPRANALNAVRLALALLVIVWHSFPLSGNRIEWHPLQQFMGQTAVDGFFAISGFLILGSWLRNPRWFPYLMARVLRIFPAFWVCLVVTAFLIAPVATMLATSGSYGSAISVESVTYVLKNAALRMFQDRIGDTPLGVPFTATWNGSMWTLWWEFLCYVGVLALGVLGLLRRSWILPAAFVLGLVAVIGTGYGPIENFYVATAARFGTMFLAGALLHIYAHRIPLTWPLVALASAATIATMWLPDYRLLGALPLAYAMFGIGALVQHPRMRLRNDLSYGTYIYAFPVQQLLASAGVHELGVPLYVAASIGVTLAAAAASWFLIERHALKLKPRRRASAGAPLEVTAQG